jgi:hypothetical protein
LNCPDFGQKCETQRKQKKATIGVQNVIIKRGESMSLREKAKTLSDFQEMIEKLEKSEFMLDPSPWAIEWVRLEDAEQAIAELKQKLRQLRDFWVAHIEPVDDEQPHPYFFTLRSFTKEEKLKVEKLLKEAKP